MLVKFTYPLLGNIYMPEHWPICWGKYQVTWCVDEGKATSLTIAFQTSDPVALPSIQANPAPGIAAKFHTGQQYWREEAETIVRTANGLLGFFAQADIDFDRPTISWEAETAEEREKLKVFSFKVEPSKQLEPLPINFDLVARCFLSAVSATDQEIPLAFMAKGRRDIAAGKYIEAYYSYFFFLETQFAPGFSNPKQVSARFKASVEITSALDEARQITSSEAERKKQLHKLLSLSDEALIEHLVATRGRLHHHALARKTGSWHPEKHREFEAEARFISVLAYVISERQNSDLLFNQKVSEELKGAAGRAGVGYTYRVEAEGGSDRYGLNGLPPIQVTMLSRAPSHQGLASLEEMLRKEEGPYERMAVRAYDVKSPDLSVVLAQYRNFTFARESS